MSLAGFSRLQTAENQRIPALLEPFQPDWVLELAPLSSSSPALPRPRERLLFDETGIHWPFNARLDALPLDSDSVPAVLLRHLWQPGAPEGGLDEAVRVLRPGGCLISVSANPWHLQAWREIGAAALQLPSWPHWQLQHLRAELEWAMPNSARWWPLLPGGSSLLVIVARKPRRPARVRRLSPNRPRLAAANAAMTRTRAA
ncbi:class I SAM-dependent methyltransferase [Wenzhouxiangella marina]|uniref:Uncharacterized protein n=1 Tax=Wenzhouxiangella marina TaxID=1579979 RepID=A0A0K0XX86_9GAMM|nr:class I SAM-dependent methyltransferase [Wenzhouxiangella marina]AKS42242.1 hypothetical protein WM2015_1875 [Wenzhouxiangella marina]MBB6085986.1 SAM-dependent methyltransferase [Wenzhouxiangella marina]